MGGSDLNSHLEEGMVLDPLIWVSWELGLVVLGSNTVFVKDIHSVHISRAGTRLSTES